MSVIEHEVFFEQPVEEVFSYVGDPEAFPEWQDGFLESEITSEGPQGMGTIYRVVHDFAGRRIEVVNEVTAYIPNERFAFKSISGNLEITGDITLQPTGGGTKLIARFEAQVGGLFRLAEPLATRIIKRQQQADWEKLKILMKTGSDE
ncbi:MAG: SRPBCC family protein [Anaerolineales bacterium]|jgi:uncharacterized membrane protein